MHLYGAHFKFLGLLAQAAKSIELNHDKPTLLELNNVLHMKGLPRPLVGRDVWLPPSVAQTQCCNSTNNPNQRRVHSAPGKFARRGRMTRDSPLAYSTIVGPIGALPEGMWGNKYLLIMNTQMPQIIVD
jgi:hypothetical protein